MALKKGVGVLLTRCCLAAAVVISGIVLARNLGSAIPLIRQRQLEDRVKRHSASPEELVQVGEQYLLRGEPLRAAELAFEARKAAPELATAHNLLGAIYGQARETDRARECFERASSLDPALLQPRLNLARIALDQEDTPRALVHLDAAQRYHPNDATVWLLTGRAFRLQERSATAHHAFRRAVELDPTLAEAHVELGLLHIAFDRPALAVAPLEEAFRLGDQSPENRGRLALALTTGPGQEVDFQRAAKLLDEVGGPVTSFGWLAHGLILSRRGDFPGARQEFAKVLKLDPKQERALYAIAESYRREGNRKAALKAMERFQQVVKERQHLLSFATRIREDGATPQLLAEYGKALLAAGRASDALAQFEAWEKLAPNDFSAREWSRRAHASLARTVSPR